MISAIILAAGTSSRMGETKQLLKIKGKSLIRTVVENVLASSIDEVIVVSGCKAVDVSSEIVDLPVKIVLNPDFTKGQGTSLAIGARNVNPESEALLVFMADQPLICSNIINELIKSYKNSSNKALRPVYKKKPGHPVIFCRSLIKELMLLHGDEGARHVFNCLGDDKLELPVQYEAVVLDVDTPEEFIKLNKC